MTKDQPRRPAPVSPDLYTREYFTTDCEGYHLLAEGPEGIPDRIREALRLAGDLSGRWILDIGCGRGELVCEAARRGAMAVGIDYAPAAIELSLERRSLLDEEARRRAEFRLADAKGLDFPDGSFDVVFFIDVYEHLYPYEIEQTLSEVRRVLRPGGSFIVHTGPNTWFYRFGYPLVRSVARLLLRKELPESLRGQYDDVMHVNEQSPWSLYRGLTGAGFRASVLPRSFFVGIRPNRWEKMAMRVLFARPQGYVFCTSLLAVARPRLRGREAEVRVGRVSAMLHPSRGGRVLLVGEGEGKLARLLSGLAETEVTWADTAAGAAEADRDLESSPGITRLGADPAALPFPSEHFDALAAQFTLDRVEDAEEALGEWRRVLRPGGSLVLAARNALFEGFEPRPSTPSRRAFTPASLRALVEGQGFRVSEVITLFPDLKLPALYRGDLGFFLILERLPRLREKGRIILLRAIRDEREAGG
ncbi:class I SAM-dependent methyltransferase [Candidatus Solincola sp.]|nr:methyltransferase domain-containing protein [Actinomycetota bacterium]MDI7251505.1 methyltransferase domain-containing protein [Actinomycetota bacterium]